MTCCVVQGEIRVEHFTVGQESEPADGPAEPFRDHVHTGMMLAHQQLRALPKVLEIVHCR